ISKVDENYTPQFLHIPQDFPNERSDQIWMLGGRKEYYIKSNEFDSKHWSGQLVDDKELKFDSSFIKAPDFPNFPKGGYSQTIVNYNNTFTLYIIGGYIYSEKYKDQVMTNYVFSYDFNTNHWSDLSDDSKKVLPPIATHRAVFVDNFILVGIGLSPGYLDFSQTSKPKDYINSNAIEKLYKFDLKTKTWELKMPNINLDKEVFDVGFALGASLDLYKNKIISYGSFKNFQQEGEIIQLGTLDYSTPQWDWKWDKVTNNNQKNNLNVKYHQTVIFNNQMLIINGISNQDGEAIYILNLDNNEFDSFLNYTGKYGLTKNPDDQNSQSFPTYIIVIIVVVSIIAVFLLILAIWFYWRYKNRTPTNYNKDRPIQAVWADNAADLNDRYVLIGENIDKVKSPLNVKIYNSNTSVGNAATSSNYIDSAEVTYFQHEVDSMGLTIPV
ncbi:hypothetical protein CONCODRAFT_12484, partial [Conidiobolus coronatus NRRL 28638]